MDSSQESPFGLAQINYIKLAMWLKLNGEQLVQRFRLPDGQIVYLFNPSPVLDDLTRRWLEEPEAHRLSRFASLVSREIRKTIRMKRALGLPLQVNESEEDTIQGGGTKYADFREN